MRFAPGTTLGQYEIVSAIGAGGMGEVYRARDRRLNRSVALKLLPAAVAGDAARRARFTREAQLLASLNHHNIAQIYGFEEGGTLVPPNGVGAAEATPSVLAMEFVEGSTLADRIAAGPLPVDESIAIAIQLAGALEYAHAAGVIHRDLKPANIKLRPDGAVKVLDFGLAKALDAVRDADNNNAATVAAGDTEPGVVLGTVGYMAPEQVRGQPADTRVDIWAFGVLLFEMLTGRNAFAGQSTSDVMAAVMRDEPAWTALPPSTPPMARIVLRRCLERDVRRRLRDIGDARLLLETADVAVDSGIAPPVAVPSRRRMLWPAATAIGFVLAIAAGIALVGRREAPSAEAIRFTVPQPRSIAWNQQMIQATLAVSPNGQQIVTATPEGLLVWSADTGSAHLLEDTADAKAPFFSPDGRYLGFFARDELRRIPIAGGPANVITAAPSGNAGTWGQDDTILYTRWLGQQIGLWQVSARGGESRLVTAAANLSELRAFPSFLPDGRHYVFLKGGFGDRSGRRICVAGIDDGEPVCVAQGDSNPLYAATGHLLFVQGGALVALPFDAKQREATGAPTTLVRNVRWFGPIGIASIAVSADGRVLAHSPVVRPRRLLWVDRTGRPLGNVGEPRLYNQVQLSPDGKRAAMDIWNADTGGRDIWVIDLASADLTRVTADPVDTYLGAWSEDGQSLIYGKPAPGPPDIYEIPVAGGTPRPLLSGPGVEIPQHRSPGTGWLAYLEVLADRDGRHIWLLPPGGAPRRLRTTPANTWDARFSPNGRLLAFVSDESGTPEVYVTPFLEQGQARRLSRGGGFMPRWRGDGRELFFFRTDGMLMAVDPAGDPVNPQPLFHIDGVTPEDAPTPPRERFAFYDVTSDGQRFLLRLAEGAGDRADDLRVWVNWASAIR
jgi:eukaryotic-like serine/threonine-protein kinase